MADLDFIYFGIKPDNEMLKNQICAALKDSVGVDFSFFTSQREIMEAYFPKRRGLFEKLKSNPILASEWLLVCYLFGWRLRKLTRIFFECSAVKGSMEKALNLKNEIEESSNSHKCCLVVIDIFREYETYLFQWEETRKHIKTQRNIVNSRRKKLFNEVVKRDGVGCRICSVTENLHLDHIISVSLGGFSILENLQLLCADCNHKKETERKRKFLRSSSSR